MLDTILRRGIRLARFAAPDPRTAWRVRRLKRGGDFDRAFYRRVHPGLHPLFHAFPERHFVVFGERAGLLPSPTAPAEGGAPGAPGRRLPVLRPAEAPPGAPFAAVVHLYYPELWPEIRDALRASGLALDLFVTVAERGEASRALALGVAEDWPSARIVRVPNRGRDVLPFVHLVNAGLLDPYRAVCKLHTKRSRHLEDGDAWRRELIAGLLDPERARAQLDAFLADDDAMFWIADGQAYAHAKWWGVNEPRAEAILRRIEVSMDPRALRFPAGSMYWMKPLPLRMVRGLGLRPEEFELEETQLDGTLAHAVERAMGYVAAAAGGAIRETSELDAAAARGPGAAEPDGPAFVSAFYLPQFHRCARNDRWWGRGFTEWTAAARARPLFAGHAQPALPSELGFYDLRVTEVMGEQAALARQAGIDAFCVYHYWFDGEDGGRRLLHAPMDGLLARPEIDFPFYLCWANEPWSRNWDGLTGEVLMEQRYAPGFEARLAASLAPFLHDPRHARPDGERPRLVVYRPGDVPDPGGAMARLRAALRGEGVGEVELGAVRFHVAGEHAVPEGTFDFWVEMPPHGLVGPDEILHAPGARSRLPFAMPDDFAGIVYDYAAVAARATDPARVDALPPRTIAGVMPSWDNTARRGHDAHLAWGANPAAFRAWLRGITRHRLDRSHRREVMVNAWNEWAERATLEPSERWGRAWLDVLAEWRGRPPLAP